MNHSDSVTNICAAIKKALLIDCFVVGDSGWDESQPGFCAQCARLQRSQWQSLKCGGLHSGAAQQAERWGGKYEYLCPLGLSFLASPIVRGGEVRFGVIAGPFLMIDKLEAEDAIECFFGGKPQEISAAVNGLAYFAPGRVSSLADLLFMTTVYAAERDSLKIRIMEQSASVHNEVFYSNDADEYPIESERKLLLHIRSGDKAASQRVLNEILGYIYFNSGSLSQIKQRVIELIVLLSRAAIEGGAGIDEIFGLNYDFVKDVSGFASLDPLNDYLSKVLMRFAGSVFSAERASLSGIVNKIIEFIRKNYMRKISLNDISEHVNFSVSYLSKLFKDETGCSVNSFLNGMRIDQSKVFLLCEDIPLVDVAFMCGYDDQSYFIKVFKKTTGVTPGKYRRMHGDV